jgi:hypothetical protein
MVFQSKLQILNFTVENHVLHPAHRRSAEAVRSLVEEFMPHMPFSDLAGFPTALRNQTA